MYMCIYLIANIADSNMYIHIIVLCSIFASTIMMVAYIQDGGKKREQEWGTVNAFCETTYQSVPSILTGLRPATL